MEKRSALDAAIIFLPSAVAGFIAGPRAGRMMRRVRPVRIAGGAFLLAATCTLSIALLPAAGIGTPLLRLMLIAGVGLGIGATVTFASSTIMGAAPPDRGGMAASIEEVGFELGNSLGVAIFGSLMTLAYAWTLAIPPDAIVPSTVRDSLDEALRAAQSLPPEVASQLRAAGNAAFGHALQAVLVGVGLLWILTAVAIMAGSQRPEPSAT